MHHAVAADHDERVGAVSERRAGGGEQRGEVGLSESCDLVTGGAQRLDDARTDDLIFFALSFGAPLMVDFPSFEVFV